MRKYITIALSLAVAFAFVASAFADDAVKDTTKPVVHDFAGVSKCMMCHKGASKGNIYETWVASKHHNAFATLGDTAAAAVMKTLKLDGKAQETAQCIACHVTNTASKEDGVTCESCHGAGGDYRKVMKDHAAAVAAGMSADPKTACVACHNDKNPTQKAAFKFDEMWPKIAHSKKPVDAK